MLNINLITLFILLISFQARSADHLDGLDVLNDPSTDITDVYAWLNDSGSINLILNVFPLANTNSRFSDNAFYVLNVSSLSAYGATPSTKKIICSFNTSQLVTCSLDNDVKISAEDASFESGVLSSNGDFRVFAGLRDDPFFFDLANFNTAREFIRDNASSLTFDGAGCPDISAGTTRSDIVGTLTGTSTALGGNGSPVDFFAGLNVLSIVVQIDKSLIGAGPIYSVQATTNRK